MIRNYIKYLVIGNIEIDVDADKAKDESSITVTKPSISSRIPFDRFDQHTDIADYCWNCHEQIEKHTKSFKCQSCQRQYHGTCLGQFTEFPELCNDCIRDTEEMCKDKEKRYKKEALGFIPKIIEVLKLDLRKVRNWTYLRAVRADL